MRITIRRLFAACASTALATVLTCAAGVASAQTTLKMAHIYNPGNIWYETAEAYAKAVEAKSGGKVRIVIAPSGTTGDWPASIEGLKIGTNDIVLQSVGTLDRYNVVAGVEAYPYLVRDIDHFKKVYYGPVGAELYDEIAKKTGFRIVGAGYRGMRHLTSSKPVRNLAEVKSIKIRVPPLKIYRLTWDTLGASTVPMGVAELFTSLQQGVIDGQENPLEVVEMMKFNEVQKFVVETGHVSGAMTWIFSDAKFKSLPADVQKLLKEEGEAAMLAATERMVRMEGEIKGRLQGKGMQFVTVDRAAFASALVPMSKEFPDLAPWVAKMQAVK
ncbi:MAG: TRAP transporter substrate-binding protein [Rubrivivax sp.]|nr:TRAP transporter substrate-binding protein [Rubrivivax sp.]